MVTDACRNFFTVSVVNNHAGIYICSANDALRSIHANVTVSVKIPGTCRRVKANISDISCDNVIDPDGEDSEVSFTVFCNMIDTGGVGVTAVSLNSERRTPLPGYNVSGSYSRDIHYIGTSYSQIKGLAAVFPPALSYASNMSAKSQQSFILAMTAMPRGCLA